PVEVLSASHRLHPAEITLLLEAAPHVAGERVRVADGVIPGGIRNGVHDVGGDRNLDVEHLGRKVLYDAKVSFAQALQSSRLGPSPAILHLENKRHFRVVIELAAGGLLTSPPALWMFSVRRASCLAQQLERRRSSWNPFRLANIRENG